MVNLLKSIKNRLPFLWNIIEFFNGIIVSVLYGHTVKKAVSETFAACTYTTYRYRKLYQSDLPALERLFATQPQGFDCYFKPHPFDIKTLKRLMRTHSFLMFGVFDEEKMIGYFFLRLFANKTAFRGKMVDVTYQRQGIAKEMGRIMTEIVFRTGFRLYATICKSNYGSVASSVAVNDIHIIKELPDNYMYIEYLKKC